MVVRSVLLCVHGYTNQPKESHRPWKKVVSDRLHTAHKLAEFFNATGVVTYLVLSGGAINNGNVEADVIYEHAKTEFPDIFKLVTDVILERESKNTQENVDEILKWAIKKNAAIVAISSKDHASRVINDWGYDKNRHEHLILVSPSNEPYSKPGIKKRPLVIEPPFWAYEELKYIFKIPKEKWAEVKKLINDAVEFGLK